MTKQNAPATAQFALLANRPMLKGLLFSIGLLASVVLTVALAVRIPYSSVGGWLAGVSLKASELLSAVMPYGSVGFNVGLGLAGLGLVVFLQAMYLSLKHDTHLKPLMYSGLAGWSVFGLLCAWQTCMVNNPYDGVPALFLATNIVFVIGGVAAAAALVVAIFMELAVLLSPTPAP